MEKYNKSKERSLNKHKKIKVLKKVATQLAIALSSVVMLYAMHIIETGKKVDELAENIIANNLPGDSHKNNLSKMQEYYYEKEMIYSNEGNYTTATEGFKYDDVDTYKVASDIVNYKGKGNIDSLIFYYFKFVVEPMGYKKMDEVFANINKIVNENPNIYPPIIMHISTFNNFAKYINYLGFGNLYKENGALDEHVLVNYISTMTNFANATANYTNNNIDDYEVQYNKGGYSK